MRKYYTPYLLEHIKKKINLADYLETEIGCQLRWSEPDKSASLICPMPNHKDNKPSFRVNYVLEDGLWLYYCWGCGAKGTVLDFFMNYYDFHNLQETVEYICKKFDIKDGSELVTDDAKNVEKKENIQKKLEYANIITSSQCRSLLRKDYNRYNRWVADIYKRLNKALDTKDIETVEAIGYDVSKKIREK